jgi:hypothetical protein
VVLRERTGDNRGNKLQEFKRTNKKEIDSDGHDEPESIDSENMELDAPIQSATRQ